MKEKKKRKENHCVCVGALFLCLSVCHNHYMTQPVTSHDQTVRLCYVLCLSVIVFVFVYVLYYL